MSSSRLGLHLGNLIEWLKEIGPVADFREIRIVEERANRGQKAPVRISKSLLHSPSDYENRFDQLFEAGHIWIRLGAVGVVEDKLIVSVDFSEGLGAPAEYVAVNMAGPAQKISKNSNWRLDWKLTDD